MWSDGPRWNKKMQVELIPKQGTFLPRQDFNFLQAFKYGKLGIGTTLSLLSKKEKIGISLVTSSSDLFGVVETTGG